MSEITVKLTAGTNVGKVRTNNEDNFIVNADLVQGDWLIPNNSSQAIPLGEAGALLVVADGMGGMNAGEVASEIAVNTIQEVFSLDDFSSIVDTDEHISQFLTSAIVEADSRIKQRVVDDPKTEGMGTTIVIAWVLENKVHIAWCGDSRAYKFNKESGLIQLSKDHSYVQQLVDDGDLTPDEAFDSPFSNIITRSLGDVKSIAKPDYRLFTLTDGDNIILCSDGLCGICRDVEILETLNSIDLDNVTNCRDALIDIALQAGGDDNVTVAILQYNTDEKSAVFHHTVQFTPKPIYKKPLPIILAVLIISILALLFLPDKCIGEKCADFRGVVKRECVALIDKAKSKFAERNVEKSIPENTDPEFAKSSACDADDDDDTIESEPTNKSSEDSSLERYGDLSELRAHTATQKEKETADAMKDALSKTEKAAAEAVKAADKACKFAEEAIAEAEKKNIDLATQALKESTKSYDLSKKKRTNTNKYAEKADSKKTKPIMIKVDNAIKEAKQANLKAKEAVEKLKKEESQNTEAPKTKEGQKSEEKASLQSDSNESAGKQNGSETNKEESNTQNNDSVDPGKVTDTNTTNTDTDTNTNTGTTTSNTGTNTDTSTSEGGSNNADKINDTSTEEPKKE